MCMGGCTEVINCVKDEPYFILCVSIWILPVDDNLFEIQNGPIIYIYLCHLIKHMHASNLSIYIFTWFALPYSSIS